MRLRPLMLYSLLMAAATSGAVLDIVGVTTLPGFVPGAVAEPVARRHEALAPNARTSLSSRGVVESVEVGAGGTGRANATAARPAAAAPTWVVRVRFDDGTTRIVYQQFAPRVRAGDRVQIVDGTLVLSA